MTRRTVRGFTIIELLVVVSIIALLVGILLPAIGKAREQAQFTKSQANLRQMAIANATYASEWHDRQFQPVNDNIANYGTDGPSAFAEFQARAGEHPFVIIGYRANIIHLFSPHTAGNEELFTPIDFSSGFGYFRTPNLRPFSQYLNGRFYDPTFYAPKDKNVVSVVEPLYDDAGDLTPGPPWYWSSYCWSPAAMFSPDVLANPDQGGATNPWELPGAFRSPTLSQALFPELKTHMLEHHWLQQVRKGCNPFFTDGRYDGCEPFYFNHSVESSPVTMFFDGHIDSISQRQVITANQRHLEQTGADGGQDWGLWNNDPALMGGNYVTLGGNGGCNGGYFHGQTQDWTCHSAHILTTDGIRGRDVYGESQ